MTRSRSRRLIPVTLPSLLFAVVLWSCADGRSDPVAPAEFAPGSDFASSFGTRYTLICIPGKGGNALTGSSGGEIGPVRPENRFLLFIGPSCSSGGPDALGMTTGAYSIVGNTSWSVNLAIQPSGHSCPFSGVGGPIHLSCVSPSGGRLEFHADGSSSDGPFIH